MRIPSTVGLVQSCWRNLAPREVEPFFRQMVEGYGGGYDVVTSTLSVGDLLRRTAAELTSQYLVRFESESEHPIRPDVEIERKGVRARAGLALLVASDR